MPLPPFSLRRFARVFPNSHARWYVAIKLATDPLYPAVLRHLQRTTAPLLDLGCGMGVLSFYLRAHGFQPPIHGIDYDARKIDAAQHVLASPGKMPPGPRPHLRPGGRASGSADASRFRDHPGHPAIFPRPPPRPPS